MVVAAAATTSKRHPGQSTTHSRGPTRKAPSERRTYPLDTPPGTSHNRLHHRERGQETHEDEQRRMRARASDTQTNNQQRKMQQQRMSTGRPDAFKEDSTSTPRRQKWLTTSPTTARPPQPRNQQQTLRDTKRTALGHVDIITSRAARPVRAGLRFNGDGLCRANRFAQLAAVHAHKGVHRERKNTSRSTTTPKKVQSAPTITEGWPSMPPKC